MVLIHYKDKFNATEKLNVKLKKCTYHVNTGIHTSKGYRSENNVRTKENFRSGHTIHCHHSHSSLNIFFHKIKVFLEILYI